MITSRTDFNETWLTEMPRGLGSFEMYDMLVYNVKDRIKNGSTVLDLGNDLKKIDGTQVKYYWYEKNGTILLGAELSVKPQGLVVNSLAKKPKLQGEPYATDLYDAILKDSNRSIKLLSDIDLSDEALKVWKRLLQQGHKISVYDRENPGQSFITIDNVQELLKYFKDDDTDHRRYQYVLSESGEVLAETRSYFNTRRMRELAGIGLID
jgi:hypothetical protein